MRRLSGRRVSGLLGTPASADAPAVVDPGELRVAGSVGFAIVRAVARLPWEPTCLVQALACQRMLRRRGIAGRLELGVGLPDGFEAHAWVTVQGTTVVGHAEDGRYRPLASFERSG